MSYDVSLKGGEYSVEYINELIGRNEDLGLALYRNSKTKAKVIDFYTNLTGSQQVSLPILFYADKYDVPMSLVFSLVWAESEFYPNAVNHNSSSTDRGLFQLNSRTFTSLSEDDFFNPITNARFGVRYLKSCLDRGENEVVAMAMYNAGPGRVARNGTPKMTLDYISRILRFKNIIESRFLQSLKPVKNENFKIREKKKQRYIKLDSTKHSK